MPNMPSWFGIVLIVAIVVGELLFCALPALLWALIGRQKLAEAFAWRRASGREYLGAALLGLGFIPWVQTLIVIQNHVWPRSMAGQAANNALMLPLLLDYPVVMTLTLPLAAAFSEELFFRGTLQRALVKRMPVWLAVGLASLLFAAVHFDIQGFIVRAMLGALLATLVLRGRSIFPAMMTHFVYDAAAIGSAAWDVHSQGLNAALRVAGRADMGVSRPELLVSSTIGTLLLAVGWGLCLSAWRRKRMEAAAAVEATAESGTVWPPAPGGPEDVGDASGGI
jgi:membrane protease YdiL (CAAX protease family)